MTDLGIEAIALKMEADGLHEARDSRIRPVRAVLRDDSFDEIELAFIEEDRRGRMAAALLIDNEHEPVDRLRTEVQPGESLRTTAPFAARLEKASPMMLRASSPRPLKSTTLVL